MEKTIDGSRLVVALVLLATTVIFLMGTVQEKRAETAREANATSDEQRHDEGSEEPGSHEETGSEVIAHTDETLTVFGIEAESPWLIGFAAGLSALLVFAVLLTKSRLVLAAIVVVCVAFLPLDIREVVHQLDVATVGLAVIAAMSALGHLASGALAGRLAFRSAAS